MKWADAGYIGMQLIPTMLVFASGKYGYGIATCFWAVGNIIAYFSR